MLSSCKFWMIMVLFLRFYKFFIHHFVILQDLFVMMHLPPVAYNDLLIKVSLCIVQIWSIRVESQKWFECTIVLYILLFMTKMPELDCVVCKWWALSMDHQVLLEFGIGARFFKRIFYGSHTCRLQRLLIVRFNFIFFIILSP